MRKSLCRQAPKLLEDNDVNIEDHQCVEYLDGGKSD